MLESYLSDPIFREVHESAKEMGTFERAYITEVNTIIQALNVKS